MTKCMSTYTLSKVSLSKFSPKVSKWSKKSFMRISENDTFESVKIESVRVDRHPQYSTKHITNLENIVDNTWGDIWR